MVSEVYCTAVLRVTEIYCEVLGFFEIYCTEVLLQFTVQVLSVSEICYIWRCCYGNIYFSLLCMY